MRSAALALILVGFAMPDRVQAQNPTELFVALGGGLGSHGTLHASVSLSHRTGEYVFRGAAGFDPELGGLFTGGGDLVWSREVTELALLYGRRSTWSWGWARGALGIGYAEGDRDAPVSPGEDPSTSAYGVAAQVGVVWMLATRFGLGLTGVGNLNEFRSLAAITVSAHFGLVR